MSDSWKTGGLDVDTVEALSHGMPASTLWSLLMHVLARRAKRDPARILEQWKRDGLLAPAASDQRTFLELDTALLASVRQFQAIELSPVAPLGACSSIGLTTQNRVLSALRGCEVVSDPTNVLALECARRLQENAHEVVRLATVHRCVRAQPFPKQLGFAAHFRIFCLATGTPKGPDHVGVAAAMVEHIRAHQRGFVRLEEFGYRFPDVLVTVLATERSASLADRICAAVGGQIERRDLQHPYYGGLRFIIRARAASGEHVPIADGGAFDWLARLTSNHKLSFVASALGTQLIAHSFGRVAPRD